MKRIMIIIVSICVVVALALSMDYSLNHVDYASDDPLYGTYVVDDQRHMENGDPADYIVSIDVPANDSVLEKAAEESGVDVSKGCWVYSFADGKVYSAEKTDDNNLEIYEKGQLIGHLQYSARRFLWKEYDVSYKLQWHSENLKLEKTLQGFVFPGKD